MKNKKLVKGFMLLDAVMALVVFSIIIGTAFSLISMVRTQKNSYEADNAMATVQKGLSEALNTNLESYTVSHKGIVYANSANDDNYLYIPKHKWVPLIGTYDDNFRVDLDGDKAINSNNRVDGGSSGKAGSYSANMRGFFKMGEYSFNNYIPYAYFAQKFESTAYGEVPYIDAYVIIVPLELHNYVKNSQNRRNELFNLMLDINAHEYDVNDGVVDYGSVRNIADINDLLNTANEYQNGTKYVDISSIQLKKVLSTSGQAELARVAKGLGLKDKDLVRIRAEFKFASVSNRQSIIKAFEESVKNVNTYAKNMKDWASIQAAMYENVVAKIGGSFNIDYFATISSLSGSKVCKGCRGQALNLYSSKLLDKLNCSTSGTASVEMCWDTRRDVINIYDTSTTLAGFVYGDGADRHYNENTTRNKASQRVYNIVGKSPISAKNIIDISVYSGSGKVNPSRSGIDKGLMYGSAVILGVTQTKDGFYNPFGFNYRYGFSNDGTYGVSVDNGATWIIDGTQQTPENPNKFAPFSALINTTFPWLYMEIKPSQSNFGYYENKVVPELR